jgi:hypothetical protein
LGDSVFIADYLDLSLYNLFGQLNQNAVRTKELIR